MADDGVFLGHFPGAEGQHDGHDGTEGFGDGRHCQSDGEEEGVHHVFVPPQHADAKQHCADHQNDDRQLSAELIQTDLKRRFPLLRVFQKLGDLAHFRVHAGGRHQKAAPPIGGKAAGEHHVLPVAQGRFPTERLRILFHRQAFAGEGTLRALQTGTFQQASVGTDGISRLQYDHITGNHLSAGDLYDLTVPQYLGGGGGHLLQAIQRCGGLDGLNGAQNCVHGDDRQNDDHTLYVPHTGGDDGGQNEDQHQKIRKLPQKNLPNTFLLAGVQFIGTVFQQTERRILL